MKKKETAGKGYLSPELETIRLDQTDIVTVSGLGEDDDPNQGEWD